MKKNCWTSQIQQQEKNLLIVKYSHLKVVIIEMNMVLMTVGKKVRQLWKTSWEKLLKKMHMLSPQPSIA